MVNIFIISALIIFIYMTTIFAAATYQKNNSIVDIAWGFGFIILAIFSLIYTGLYLPRQLLATALIIIWGTRLSLHIYRRNKGKSEDPRYAEWRKAWGKHVIIRSFFQIFMLQGIILLIIVCPILVINTSTDSTINALDILGLTIWLTGLIIQGAADYQLFHFIKEKSNGVMKKGLWRYSRHPNYFGEATMWWGIFVIALSVPNGIFTIISPLTITALLCFVSGIPLAEKSFKGNKEYEQYQNETSAFIPWFVKK